MDDLFDVIEVNSLHGDIRIMAEAKTKKNAEAIEAMAVMRRGGETNFFTTVPAGKYSEGDSYWLP